MNKPALRNLAVAAAALCSLCAGGAYAASDQGDSVWPEESPATVSFGDTDHYWESQQRHDVPATLTFVTPGDQSATVLAGAGRSDGAAPAPSAAAPALAQRQAEAPAVGTR